MVFSRISVDFGTSWSSPLVDDDAGDLGLQELPDCVGYFPLIVDSPRLDVFFCSTSSLCVQKALDVPLLPTSSPPHRVMRHSVRSISSLATSPGVLRASPSWASNGLCITGLLSSPPVVIPGSDPLCGAASMNHEEIASVSSEHSSQTHFHLSMRTPSIAQDFCNLASDSATIHEDFVGVLNIGYPLRPSRASLNLPGLGILIDAYPDDSLEDTDPTAADPGAFQESLSSSSSDHWASIVRRDRRAG